MTTLELSKEVVRLIDEKKATDIKLIDIHEQTSIGDYFIIATASSVPHVKNLADEIDRRLKSLGVSARSFEGYTTADWILLDYGDIIIHLFRGEIREFYSLERLWKDSPTVDISALVNPE